MSVFEMHLRRYYRCYGGYLLVSLLSLKLVLSWRSYDTDIVGYHFEICDASAIKDCNLSLKQRKHRRVLNGSLTFAKDISNLLVQISVKVPRPNSEHLTIIDTTLNACEALQQANGNLIRIILAQFQKTNAYFPRRCPIQGNRPIVVDDFYIDPEMFPPYMPELNYTCNFHLLSDDNKYIFKSITNGTVRSRRKRTPMKAAMASLKWA